MIVIIKIGARVTVGLFFASLFAVWLQEKLIEENLWPAIKSVIKAAINK